MRITQDLDLNMSWTFNKLLNKDTIITKAIHSLGFTSRKTFGSLFIIKRHTQAFTAAAC